MSVAAVVAVAVLVAGAVLFVAWPYVSPGREPPEAVLDERGRRRLDLLERRDAAYAALRELEQDVRTGKVTEADYAAERARLRREAAEALRELDGLE